MDTEGFDDLLHEAQKLTAGLDRSGAETLPRVERNLNQLKDAADKLAYRGPYADSTSESTFIKASLLLGSRGFDVQKACQKLEGLGASKTFEPLDPIRDTDIQGFLKNERENTLLAAVENSRTATSEDIQQKHWESLECEWESVKQELLMSLVDTGSNSIQLDVSQDRRAITTDSSIMISHTNLDSTEVAYAKQVSLYNAKRVEGSLRPSLVDMFAEVAKSQDNANADDLWTVVSHMINVTPQSTDNVTTLRRSALTQISFIKQALQYLEKSYVRYMQKVVYGSLQAAQLGGMPSTLNFVRSFLNVKKPVVSLDMEQGGTYNGQPVWAVLYYCLRCGDINAAMEVVTQSRQALGDLARYIEEYASNDNHRLSAGSEAELRLLYRRSVHSTMDPYKKAVCCVIGTCDPRDDHVAIAGTLDDYLWLKLRQLSVGEESDLSLNQQTTPTSSQAMPSNKKSDRLSFTQFQKMLLEEYGETHFSAHQQPFLYFRLLMLTGQFEAAIEFLSRVDPALIVYAVHAALVLYESGLLLIPNNIHSLLLSRDQTEGGTQLLRLNFVRLITIYTRKFESRDPSTALEYFYLLREIKRGEGERDMFSASVSELALESKEFGTLFGRLQLDGTRVPGAVDKFRVDTKKLIAEVAESAEHKGRLENAVSLYDLSMNVEKVVELLNKLLSQVLSNPPADNSNRDRMKELAISIASRYKTMSIEASRNVMATFHLQLDLLNFFDLYHRGQHEQAYNLIRALNLLPFTTDVVAQKVGSFNSYTDEIRRNIPDILLATMAILLTKYKSIKGTGNDSITRSPLVTSRAASLSVSQSAAARTTIDVTYIRSEAQALIMFAGMIPYRMPGDTNSRLVHMEVQMS